MIKEKLHALCKAYVSERITALESANRIIQSSANEETKSSAGDKYETGRAMAQLEIEKNASQLAEVKKLQQQLSLINPARETTIVQPGSVVLTDNGNYYISIPAGQLTVGSQSYYAISPASPIAKLLLGLKKGEKFIWHAKEHTIADVH